MLEHAVIARGTDPVVSKFRAFIDMKPGAVGSVFTISETAKSVADHRSRVDIHMGKQTWRLLTPAPEMIDTMRRIMKGGTVGKIAIFSVAALRLEQPVFAES